MSSKAISELDALTTSVDADLLVIVDVGESETKKQTKGQFLTEIQAQADTIEGDLDTHVDDTSNPHQVTKEQVGLGSVLNVEQIPATEKGAALGVATLDGAGKVPVTQLPSSIMEYKGTWDASTNTPTLADGTGDNGDVYRVSVAGTVNFGSGAITFGVGDYVIYNGTIWEKSDTTDAVSSVNGYTGTVTLDTDDIGEGSTNLYSQWATATGGINYAGGNVGIGTSEPLSTLHMVGTSPAISIDDGTYKHILKNSRGEGLSGSDFRIGLDESLRRLIICDIGDIDNDFGLSASATPELAIYSASASSRLTITSTGITGSNGRGSINIVEGGFTFNRNNSDLSSGNMFDFTSTGATELTASSGEQAWMYLAPKINQSGTANFVGLLVSTTETALGSGTNAIADFRSGSTSRLFIANGGNVGIGTSTPGVNLDVVGTIIRLDSSANANIIIDRGGTNRLGSMTYSTAGTDNWYSGMPDSDIRGDGTEYFIGTSNSDPKLWIETGGHIGMGTESPNISAGSALALTLLSASGSRIELVRASDSITDGQQLGSIDFYAGSATKTQVAGIRVNVRGTSEDAGDLIFQTKVTAGSFATRMTILSSGNVGIGQTNPSAMFVVGGSQTGNAGFEIVPGSGVVAQSYNRTSGAYASLQFDGATTGFRVNATSGTLHTFRQLTTTLAGTTTGAAFDYSTSVTNASYNMTGIALTTAAVTAAASNTLRGFTIAPGAITNASGTTTYRGIEITMPNITQSAGTLTSTGLYIAAGTITSGTAYALIVESGAGNVGIGTTAPEARLEVVTNTNAPARTFFTNTDTGTGAYTEVNIRNGAAATDSLRLITLGTGWTTNGRFVQDGANLEASSGLLGGLSISTAASAPIRFYTSGSNERMRITESGSIGIGTTSPTYLLDVSGGDVNTSGNYKIAGINRLGTLSAFTLVYDQSGGQAMLLGGTGSAGNYYQNTIHVFRGRGGVSERMRIDSSGNVGIGTTSPVTLLNPSATDTNTTVTTGNSPALRITNRSTTDDTMSEIGFSSIDATAAAELRTSAILGVHTSHTQSAMSGAMVFATRDAGTFAERMRLTSGGNLGIGTTSPNANAILDLVSTTKAFMPPRMTTTEKNAVASPTASMVVYDTTLGKLCVYGAAAWETLTSV